MKTHVLGFVRVVKTPEVVKTPGEEAPIEIRQKFVGLIMPIAAILDIEYLSEICERQIDCYGVVVTFENALAAVTKLDLSAAEWISKGYDKNPNAVLILRSDEVEFLDANMQKPTPVPIHRRFGMRLECETGAHEAPVYDDVI